MLKKQVRGQRGQQYEAETKRDVFEEYLVLDEADKGSGWISHDLPTMPCSE